MDRSTLLLDELLPELATDLCRPKEGPHVERIHDVDTGVQRAFVIQSDFERVAVFSRRDDELSLSAIGAMRRSMRAVQARRGLVWIPEEAAVSTAVALLATLSKIEIVRLRTVGRA